jgi:hypothetical protein
LLARLGWLCQSSRSKTALATVRVRAPAAAAIAVMNGKALRAWGAGAGCGWATASNRQFAMPTLAAVKTSAAKARKACGDWGDSMGKMQRAPRKARSAAKRALRLAGRELPKYGCRTMVTIGMRQKRIVLAGLATWLRAK